MFEAIITYFSGVYGLTELVATIFGIICVYLAAKHNIWTWFWGALSVALFGWLFFEYKLYSDALLQILFYLPISGLGYWYWTRWTEKTGDKTTTRALTSYGWGLAILAIIIPAAVTGYTFDTFTDAHFPYFDAFIAWMSVTAQILMLRKFWESWVLWVTVDVLSVYLYFAKELYVTSGLYVIYFFLASYGLWVWFRDMQRSKLERRVA